MMTAKDLRDAAEAGTMTRDEATAVFAAQECSAGPDALRKAAYALFGGSAPATAASRQAVASRKAKRKLLDSIADLRDAEVRALSTDADLAR